MEAAPSNLAELIQTYFDLRELTEQEGQEWKPGRQTIYLTEYTYKVIINDPAFGEIGGPDIVSLVKPTGKKFMGMKIKVV